MPLAAPSEAVATPSRQDDAILLELFTSQGCSSCPPADALLAKLGADPELRGRIVPLAFHVDYWNYIGWSDPFSAEAWTARQNEYSRAFAIDGVYTPQLVVGGRAQMNGSDEGHAREAIAAALADAGAVHLTIGAPKLEGARLTVPVSAETLREGPALRVSAVIYESGLSTSVRRGENGGRELRNEYVVRTLSPAFELGAARGAHGSGDVAFTIDPSWTRANLGVAVFAQDPATLKIYAASTVPAL